MMKSVDKLDQIKDFIKITIGNYLKKKFFLLQMVANGENAREILRSKKLKLLNIFRNVYSIKQQLKMKNIDKEYNQDQNEKQTLFIRPPMSKLTSKMLRSSVII